MKIITLAAWRRPDYFSQVVKSLENAEGIEEYLVLVALMVVILKGKVKWSQFCEIQN